MICDMEDQKKIYKAQLKDAYKQTVKFGNKDKCAPSEQTSIRQALTARVDKALLFSRGVYFTEMEKQREVFDCKKIYREYIDFIRGNEEGITSQLECRIDQMLDLLTDIETQGIITAKRQMGKDIYIDLEGLFCNSNYLCDLLKHPASDLVRKAFKDPEVDAVRINRAYFTTRYGKKYHAQGCPRCKGKLLCVTNEYILKRDGTKPCGCVIDYEKSLLEEKRKHDESRYITAFIDESIRINPGYYFDDGEDRDQNVLSVILCKGQLTKESDITKENTIDRYMSIATRTSDLSETTMEAIGYVLLKGIARDFSGRVIIYTDNSSVCKKWREKDGLRKLSTSFESVKVTYKSRSDNKEADSILRKNSIMQLPKGKMDDIISLYTLERSTEKIWVTTKKSLTSIN